MEVMMKNLNDARTALMAGQKLKFWLQVKDSLISPDSNTIDMSLRVGNSYVSIPIPHQQVMDYVDKRITDYQQLIIDLDFDPNDLSRVTDYNY
jgi:hypothetical protein